MHCGYRGSPRNRKRLTAFALKNLLMSSHMELNAELARQFEEKTGNPLLKTISVKCIDRSGRQILNLYARYDIVNSYYGFLIALDGGGELEKLLLDEVVEFDLDEEHDSEVRGFLREIISGSWRFDVETFISDYMSGDDEDPYVKMQREMTSPLGANTSSTLSPPSLSRLLSRRIFRATPGSSRGAFSIRNPKMTKCNRRLSAQDAILE